MLYTIPSHSTHKLYDNQYFSYSWNRNGELITEAQSPPGCVHTKTFKVLKPEESQCLSYTGLDAQRLPCSQLSAFPAKRSSAKWNRGNECPHNSICLNTSIQTSRKRNNNQNMVSLLLSRKPNTRAFGENMEQKDSSKQFVVSPRARMPFLPHSTEP